LTKKNGTLYWRPGPVKVSKHALIVKSPRENSTPKSKKFFFVETTRLAKTVDGSKISSAQSAGEL